MNVEIGLIGEPSTGYGWESDRDPDDRSYEVRGTSDDDDDHFGGEVFETFVFNDLRPGTVLTFSYQRSWETDVDPIKTVQLLVEEH